MSDDRQDIQTREDCERLVRAFYGRALHDPLIGWIFTDVAKLDLEEHVPTITSFWETMLLGARSYGGGAFAPHVDIHYRAGGLRRPHFERWLLLWRTTVDELFAGPRAEEAKAHALRVGAAFHSRLQTLPTAEDAQAPAHAPAAGLTITQHGAPPTGV
ncbi:group III truncated hemoglobin [Baekduia sp.]|uniref:group III truncated hemoglobin n=1 Tax=Baekduia sp. TaxID=2600305 RepID=UPI002DFC58FC|nr:group III truncated hemoglobin [Baekduia sp.]